MRVLLSHHDRQSAERLRGEIQAWDPTWQVEIAASAEEFLALVATTEYPAVIWEISTPGAAGLLSVRQIRGCAPATALVVTAFPGAEALAAQALSEGADVYVIRRAGWLEELLAVLSQVEALSRRRRECAGLEREVRRLRDQHVAFLDSVPRPVMVLTATGRIEACNQAAVEFIGQPREHLIGEHLGAMLLVPAYLDGLFSALNDAQQSPPPPGPGLLSAWRDGEEIAAELLIAEAEGRYRLSSLSLRRLTSTPGGNVLASFGGSVLAAAARMDRPAGLADVVWESPTLYVAQTDGDLLLLRLGAGLREGLGEEGQSATGRPAAELFGVQAVQRVREALESSGHFSGEVDLNLGPDRSQPCHLDVTKAGSGSDELALWIASPLREDLSEDQAHLIERAVVNLTDAVGCLEGVREPHELPQQVLEAAAHLVRSDAGVCRLDLACNGEGRQALEASRGLSAANAESVAQRLETLLRGGSLPPQALVFSDLDEHCRCGPEVTLQLALGAEGLASAVWIPVAIGGEPVGFVFLGSRQKGAFQSWLQPVLNLLSAEIGRAASAVTLFYQTQLSASLAQQLLRISVALNSRDDLEDVLRRVAEAAVNISGGTCCWVEILDEQAQQFVSTFRHCPDHQLAQELYVEVHRAAWEAVETQAPAQAEAEMPGGTRCRIIAVPLRSEGRVVGVMTLGHLEARRVGATVLNALQVLATQAAAAVRNMQLLALAAERTRRMEAAAVQAREEEGRARTVLQAAASVTESRDLRETIAQIARSAAQEIGFERVRVFLADHQAGVLRGRAEAYSDGSVLSIDSETVPLRAGADLLADVALSSAPYLMYSVTGEGEEEGSGYEQLFMPLRWQGELMGIIAADNRSSQRSISSQQTRLLRALATLAAVAIERARMDEVRHQLVSAVSHELRRPLASIQAYNELLLDEDAGPVTDEQKIYLRRVEEGCGRMGRMIEDLLDWSRLRSGKITVDRQKSDLRDTVREVADELSPKARQAEVDLSVEAADELPPVETDANLLEQVLSNLVENAIKYNHPGGRVAVRLRSDADSAVIEVSDTGPGIPPEFRGRIFEEFERGPRELHGQTEGTGLGLSIAARLTEYLGGSLELRSTVGEGSTFSVRLPYAQS